MTKLVLLCVFLVPLIALQNADAATIKQTMDGGMDISITYPDSVIVGRGFEVSVFVQNNGWEDKQHITFAMASQDDAMMTKNGTISIERLSKNGSYGATVAFTTSSEAQPGMHYLNVLYSQVLLSNNETPTAATQKNIAIPIEIKREPHVQLNTVSPSSIFPNAEFQFDVELLSSDMDLRDVAIDIKAPSDVSIRGQTAYTFSLIQKGVPVQIQSQIVTTPDEVTLEHKLPFEVTATYLDDAGEERTTSKTVSLLLRPRTFMEFTTDGGVWVGGVFLAPYVSIGTLVGIPAGALFSLLIHRLQKKKNTKKRKNK
ncbi:hypothetical protein [Candidatus Nitrosotenuis cloacae]|uniref:hypothetical protein n=1 Tax=Candidatus Nitrosotenuis cloacae TaxID=1603555 RepID=UPI00228247C0|nr:hypothetical protein [Candidatus Nitrosotenuis cloacae]